MTIQLTASISTGVGVLVGGRWRQVASCSSISSAAKCAVLRANRRRRVVRQAKARSRLATALISSRYLRTARPPRSPPPPVGLSCAGPCHATSANMVEHSEAGVVRHMNGSALGPESTDAASKRGRMSMPLPTSISSIRRFCTDGPLRYCGGSPRSRKIGRASLMVHYPPYHGGQPTIDMVRLFANEVVPHVTSLKASAT